MTGLETWKDFVEEVRRRADLFSLAQEGGLEPRRKGSNAVARCPFHQDRNPSLHLYLEDDPHYHCFACGAHGDAIRLFQHLAGLEFRTARDQLASRYGVQRPRGTKRSRASADPFAAAHASYQSQADEEKLEEWRRSRGLNTAVIQAAQATVSTPGKLSRDAAKDPNTERLFGDAGLIVEARGPHEAQLSLPAPRSYRDFFAKQRVLLPVRDLDSRWLGFVGRALSEEDQPKYLFTPRLRTSRVLYGGDRVRAAIREWRASDQDRVFRLFVVEGLVDVLRLEQLGFHAVALLGTSLSANKIELLAELARDVERREGVLATHVFLDADPPGIRASAGWLPRLLRAASALPYLVDVVWPDTAGEEAPESGGDPDSLLRDVRRKTEARKLLDAWSYSAADGLLAASLGCHPKDLGAVWEKAGQAEKTQVLRQFERSVSSASGGDPARGWRWIADRINPFAPALREPVSHAAQDPLRGFLGLGEARTEDYRVEPVATDAPQAPHLSPTESAKLSRALQVARASTQRREFPTDHGAWERMMLAESAFLHAFARMLFDPPPKESLQPLLATFLPKPDGRPRLKATPSPERLVVQQYMLSELLRDGPEGSDFSDALPAVRYLGGPGTKETWSTGVDLPEGEKVVSFAYQVRMDVVNGLATPGREGMFRPYFECWRDFVGYLDGRVRRVRASRVHAVRLDIRGFYDNLSRSAVLDVLKAGVDRAFGGPVTRELVERAPLFRPQIRPDLERERLAAIVDWLIDQSFDYSYLDPGSGEKRRAGSRGVPQGPDLSAYLANISLFKLDERLSHLVRAIDAARDEQDVDGFHRSAVYARYVDDIVLVASTASDLRRLREAVEVELGKLGLELNDKSEPLPAMSVAKFRHWLTQKRGGLGVSDPFGEPNEEESLFRLGALADAGEVDRSQSMSIFYSTDLDRQSVPWPEIRERLRIALTARDLRFGEFEAAARGLWRGVAESLETGDTAHEKAAQVFAQLWQEMNILPPPQLGQGASALQSALVANLPSLAALQGLERFLSRRMDQSFHLEIKDQEAISAWRRRLAELVVSGLVQELLETLGGDPTERDEFLGHMLALRARALLWVALKVLGVGEGQATREVAEDVRGSRFQTWAWRSFHVSTSVPLGEEIDLADLRADPWSLFHAAIGRLQIFEARTTPTSQGHDPLQPLRETVLGWSSDSRTADPSQLWVGPVLDYWIPDDSASDTVVETEVSERELAAGALASLINLAPSECAALLSKRSRLLQDLLSRLEPPFDDCRFLPALPGTSSPGLVGVSEADEAGTLVLISRQTEEAEPPFLPALEWEPLEESEHFRIERTPAEAGVAVLPPVERRSADSGLLREIAEQFEQLAEFVRQFEDDSWGAVPAAQNLYRCESGELGVFGFLAHREYLEGTAFVRLGSSYLRHPVPSKREELWRIGVALADHHGRADLMKGSESVRLSPAYLALDPSEDWIAEAMLRTSLSRLSGSVPTASKDTDGASAFPRSVEWLLRRLESFPSRSGPTAPRLAALLVTHIWGPAWRARLDPSLQVDPSLPGFGTGFLATVASKYFANDSRLAEDLPSVGSEQPGWRPRRRSAYAWFRVGRRLEKLLPYVAEDRDPALAGLVSGAYLWSLNLELRAVVAEQIAMLPESALQSARELSPALEVLDLDHRALLHWRQEQGDATDGLRCILGVTSGDAPKPDLRDATPLGALVALALLTMLLPSAVRGRGLPGFVGSSSEASEKERQRRELIEGLRHSADLLARLGDGRDLDGPLDDLSQVIAVWSSFETVRQPLELIRQIDDLAGIECRQEVGDTSLERRDERVEFRSSRGVRRLESFQVVRSNLRDDKDWESVDSGQSVLRVWSESWCDDLLVGVSLIHQGLGRLAQTSPVDPPRESAIEPMSRTAAESPKPPVSSDALGAAAPTEDEPTPAREEPAAPTGRGSRPTGVEATEAAELAAWRETSWERRGKLKPRRHVRVGLLQWFGGNSYEHPRFESFPWDPKPREQWPEGDVASALEHRRRKILERVLEVCNKLQVQALVIPEYTLRADTVRWLYEDKHAAKAPSTSLWCGTYKVPFGGRPFLGDQPHDRSDWVDRQHQALLTVLKAPDRRSGSRLELRAKKYAAVSLREDLKLPHKTGLSALLADCVAADVPESTIFELICAEAFLAVSSTNLLALARESQRSWVRYGIAPSLHDPFDRAVEMCKEDLAALSKMTSLTECETPPRRSIVLVPAMTSRIQDYALFAQSAFLANGVSMALANAVNGKGGRSCFIGQDSWDVNFGLQPPDPYHGVQPGIYRQASQERGYLGRQEEALVVADIDPDNALGGKPSPEALPPALRLVAHIPILSSWSFGLRARRPVFGEIEGWAEKVQELRRDLAQALQPKHGTTARDLEPNRLAKALRGLVELQRLGLDKSSKPDWLELRRKAYLNHHGLKPESWPPPVALDYLCVNLGSLKQRFPKIEVPASRAGDLDDQE